jgi:hypothetical protein
MIFRRYLLVALPLFVLGCGDGHSVVSGTITFEGKPIPDGEISFHPDDRSAAIAAPIKNGSYRLALRPGGARVQIIATRSEGQTALGPGSVQYLPKQYNEASELHVDIEVNRTNIRNFDLKP